MADKIKLTTKQIEWIDTIAAAARATDMTLNVALTNHSNLMETKTRH